MKFSGTHVLIALALTAWAAVSIANANADRRVAAALGGRV